MRVEVTNDIIQWVKKLPYWKKYLAAVILSGNDVSVEEQEKAYQYFKEDNNLLALPNHNRVDIICNTSYDKSSTIGNICFEGVGDVVGINALKSDEKLSIGTQLSIIYGENGAGKTGYARLFNNAFKSKGDKSLLPNIYANGDVPQAANFFFNVAGTHVVLRYPDEKDNIIFDKICVFDAKSASDNLASESEVDFVPNEFIFFERFMNAVIKISNMLLGEIESSTKDNEFTLYFDKPSIVNQAISNLNEQADISEIQKLSAITDEDMIKYEADIVELNRLRALNVYDAEKNLLDIKKHLKELKSSLISINSLFSKENITLIQAAICRFIENHNLAAFTGSSEFVSENILQVESKEWKQFISSAKAYADKLKNNCDVNFTNCIFCLQPLNQKEIDLISKYWSYLLSQSEQNLKNSELEINALQKKYSSLNLQLLSDDKILTAWILQNNTNEYNEIKSYLENISLVKEIILKSLNDRQWDSSPEPNSFNVGTIDEIINTIDSSIAKLDKDSISKKIAKLEINSIEYNDRKKLKPLLGKIDEYVKSCQWIKEAKKKKIVTTSITNKQKELFKKYITSDYLNRFNDECKRLKADFQVEVRQRGSKGVTLKKLSIKEKTPSYVLSEGEQRALSLACFLAEINMADNNVCAIFDDPVNSLDHKRRSIIARRLVDEAAKRQIVVFTHDITFFIELKELSEKNCISPHIITIRNINNTPGVIFSAFPWPALNVKDRIAQLNKQLEDIKVIEKSGDVDEYFYRAKTWCGLLRESWERSVEEILLNDSIQRFNPSVQTQRLKKAPFTHELYQQVEDGMATCSKWVHDQARAINVCIPDTKELTSFISSFSEFVKQNRPK